MLNSRKANACGPMPAVALPGWITAQVIAETRVTWQPFYEKILTDDEIVCLLLNVGTLFRVLKSKPYGGACGTKKGP